MITAISRDKCPRTCAVFIPPLVPSTLLVGELSSVLVLGSVVSCVGGALVVVGAVKF